MGVGAAQALRHADDMGVAGHGPHMGEPYAHRRANRLHPGWQISGGGVAQPDDQLVGAVVGGRWWLTDMVAALAGKCRRHGDG